MSTHYASASEHPARPSLFTRLLQFLARLLGLTSSRLDPLPDPVDDGIGADGSDSPPWSMPPPPPR